MSTSHTRREGRTHSDEDEDEDDHRSDSSNSVGGYSSTSYYYTGQPPGIPTVTYSYYPSVQEYRPSSNASVDYYSTNQPSWPYQQQTTSIPQVPFGQIPWGHQISSPPTAFTQQYVPQLDPNIPVQHNVQLSYGSAPMPTSPTSTGIHEPSNHRRSLRTRYNRQPGFSRYYTLPGGEDTSDDEDDIHTPHCQTLCTCLWKTALIRVGLIPHACSSLTSHELAEYLLEAEETANADSILRQFTPNESLEVQNLLFKLNNMVSNRQASKLIRRWQTTIAERTGELPDILKFKANEIRLDPVPASGGGLADVYHALADGNPVAMKIVRAFHLNSGGRKELYQEILTWSSVCHRNILPFLGVVHNILEPRIYLVSPWMKNGNIREYIDKEPGVNRIHLLMDAAAGIQHLHLSRPAFVHGDIKGANILIDNKGKAVLADFGMASLSLTLSSHTKCGEINNQRGTIRWMAPELFQNQVKISRSSDIWAFGMTMLEVFTCKLPFRECATDMQVLRAIVVDELVPSRPPLERYPLLVEDIWTLMKKCWRKDPASRPLIHHIQEDLSRAARRNRSRRQDQSESSRDN